MEQLLLNNDGTKAEEETLLSFEENAEDFLFYFESEYNELYSPFSEYNSAVYEGDAIEIFLTLGGEKCRYLEMEVSPDNVCFCAIINNDGEKFSAELLSDCIFSSESHANGAVWKCAIKLNKKKFASISKDGELFFNAFRLITDKDSKVQTLMALSPTKSATFHKPECFIKLPRGKPHMIL